MTVASTTNKLYYSGNGTTTTFPYTYKIFDDDELVVTLRNTSTGAETTQTLNSDYTVTGAGDDSGGNVEFTSAPSSSYQVIIKRELDLKQETDYEDGSALSADTLEGDFDRLIMIEQQQQEELDRSLKIPLTDDDDISVEIPSSVDRASKYLSFDSSGNPMATAGTNVNVTDFVSTLLDDADATSFLTTLGVTGPGYNLATASTSGDIYDELQVSDFVEGLMTEPASADFLDKFGVINPHIRSALGAVWREGFFTHMRLHTLEREWEANQYYEDNTLTVDASGGVEWDLSAMPMAVLEVSGSCTVHTINEPSSGLGMYTLKIYNQGSYTVSWAANFYWPDGGTAPTITSSGVDIISFMGDCESLYGSSVQNFA